MTCQLWALWLLYVLIWLCWRPGFLFVGLATLLYVRLPKVTYHEPNWRDCWHLAFVALYVSILEPLPGGYMFPRSLNLFRFYALFPFNKTTCSLKLNAPFLMFPKNPWEGLILISKTLLLFKRRIPNDVFWRKIFAVSLSIRYFDVFISRVILSTFMILNKTIIPALCSKLCWHNLCKPIARQCLQFMVNLEVLTIANSYTATMHCLNYYFCRENSWKKKPKLYQLDESYKLGGFGVEK